MNMEEDKYKLEKLIDTLVLCHDLLDNSGADEDHLLRIGFITAQISNWYDLELKKGTNKKIIPFRKKE